MKTKTTRRKFIQNGSLATGALLTPYIWTKKTQAGTSKNDRHRVGAIGIGGRGKTIMKDAATYGGIVAVCDVDSQRAEAANQMVGGKAEVYADYRKLLERSDLDAVLIATPDHWHAKISIDAMLSGRDIYGEKPLARIFEAYGNRRIVQYR